MDIKRYRETFQIGNRYVPATKRYFEDFEVGEKFNTPAKFITSTEVDLFCMMTGHGGPHIDSELAKNMGFKDKLVPGFFTISQMHGLMHQIGLSEQALLFLGLNNVRFTQAVYPGDSIRFELQIVGKKDVSKWKESGIITSKFCVINQDDLVVCEGEASHQFERRMPLP